MPQNQLGTFRQVLNVSREYARMAREDEVAANSLAEAGHYRHALYFVVQSMEKHLRAKIFSVADYSDDSVRQANRNHSVEDAVLYLVGTVCTDTTIRTLIQEQFDVYLFRGVRFNLLHNDLRYPSYFDRISGYACLEISPDDVINMFERLDWLKEFLKELNLLV